MLPSMSKAPGVPLIIALMVLNKVTVTFLRKKTHLAVWKTTP